MFQYAIVCRFHSSHSLYLSIFLHPSSVCKTSLLVPLFLSLSSRFCLSVENNENEVKFGTLRRDMGNCLRRQQKVQYTASSQSNSAVTKVSSKSTLLSASSDKSLSVSLPTPRSRGDSLPSPHLKAFTFSELKSATRNFRPDSLIGEGGFGYVYKGWIDEQTLAPAKAGAGVVVAVKKLKPEGFQGHKEWLSEVTYLGQLHHPNLVKLIGYCVDGDHRLLVYEYMPKGSLENHLFRRGARPLPWALRIKVAIDAARGLTFLHDSEQPVIYRDFKASNILLDSEFNAKLSDFGLAKDGPTGDRSHVSTQIMGTQGYAAPEYLATGRLTSKCDVYSFGVVLLELLSGRRAMDKGKVGPDENLVEWAKPYLVDKRRLFRIMDTKLEGQYSHRGASQAALLAYSCISDAKQRPPMSVVLAALEKISLTKPGSSPSRPSLERISVTRNVSSPSLPDQQSSPSPGQKSPLGSNYSSHTLTPRGSPLQPLMKSPLRH